MPPHCDARDGPVALAALAALDAGNVRLVLPFVPPEHEGELVRAFAKADAARSEGPHAESVAQEWFLETAVRLHRAGEGAPFEGLKPAGLDAGPAIRLAEEAVETGDPSSLIGFLDRAVSEAIHRRLGRVGEVRDHDPDDVPAARAYTSAMLEFLVFAHHVHESLHAEDLHEGPARAVSHAH